MTKEGLYHRDQCLPPLLLSCAFIQQIHIGPLKTPHFPFKILVLMIVWRNAGAVPNGNGSEQKGGISSGCGDKVDIDNAIIIIIIIIYYEYNLFFPPL